MTGPRRELSAQSWCPQGQGPLETGSPLWLPSECGRFVSSLPSLEATKTLLTGSGHRSNFSWSFLQGHLSPKVTGAECVLQGRNSLHSELDLGRRALSVLRGWHLVPQLSAGTSLAWVLCLLSPGAGESSLQRRPPHTAEQGQAYLGQLDRVNHCGTFYVIPKLRL